MVSRHTNKRQFWSCLARDWLYIFIFHFFKVVDWRLFNALCRKHTLDGSANNIHTYVVWGTYAWQWYQHPLHASFTVYGSKLTGNHITMEKATVCMEIKLIKDIIAIDIKWAITKKMVTLIIMKMITNL